MLQEESIPAVYPTIVHTKQEEVYQTPMWQSSSPGPVHYPQLQSVGPVGSASGYTPMPVQQAPLISSPPMQQPQQQPQRQVNAAYLSVLVYYRCQQLLWTTFRKVTLLEVSALCM